MHHSASSSPCNGRRALSRSHRRWRDRGRRPLGARARSVGASEALEDLRECVRGTPSPPSATSMTTSPAEARDLSSIVSPVSVYFTAFSSSASSAARRPSGSTVSVPATSGPRFHARGATSDQRMKTSSRIRLEVDLLEDDEVGLVGLREQEQPLEDLFDPLQLVERHVDLVSRVAVRSPVHLEMAARDRDRRAQLVRRVVEKSFLPLQAAMRAAPPGARRSRVHPGAGAHARPWRGTSPTSAAPRTTRPRAGHRRTRRSGSTRRSPR